jgi:hypothetical protein
MATLNVADLSAEQREIWQAEQKYWTLVKAHDVEELIALAHHRVTIWPHFAPAPIDGVHFREDLRGKRNPIAIATYELSLHVIEMHGDAAIVHYTIAATSITTPPGAAAPNERRTCITHTWIRDHGTWRLAGGMSRPAG